jgi:hypothetical protein
LHNYKWNWTRFSYGVIGAAAPEIIRIYKTGDVSLAHSGWFMWIIALLFVFLGGVFADAWQDEHKIKWLYLGASFQVWFAAWAHLVSPH